VKLLATFYCASFLCSGVFAQSHKSNGPVNDSATAIQIAEKALFPVYGKKKIQSEEPFTAELKDGVWIVHGTLHCPGASLCEGGTAEARISQLDGRVLSLGHYK